MAKVRSVYVCSNCEYENSKWLGKCPHCGEWNTFEEVVKQSETAASAVRTAAVYGTAPMKIGEIQTNAEFRYNTGLGELDRVLGGGIVKGSIILVGGDPGIGKSTILLQICEHLGKGQKVLYVSGEESAKQIKLRAMRLGVTSDALYILTETSVEIIAEHIGTMSPDIVIIDSIQTMGLSSVSSSPGSVTQIRESTNYLTAVAKMRDIPVFLVGHVNKDGALAGPKVLEHIVDVVLYFEGDRNMSYRILRAVKNRYGSTNEIGVFEMSDHGLMEVENPSMMLLSGRPVGASGSCVACVMEGTRPILAEVQGLACQSAYENPRRMSTGFDHNRLALLIAVLEKRAGYLFHKSDTYINVVGGLRLDEPAADLAVAAALISSLTDTVISDDVVIFGELGLAGEIRSVSHAETRIKEAERLGFKRCILPKHNADVIKLSSDSKIKLIAANDIADVAAALR